MELSEELEGKLVRLIDMDGDIFEGIVGDYVDPYYNEPEGIAAVILDYPVRGDGYQYANPVQLNAPEIKSIEIIGES
ncbi:hypothetical protein D1159_05615 [Pseudoflavonifractor sp. 524-17]|uniref:hypothetical protein n=1 Tax=Pseudoflavonifractor sp. 524-17 TaxID=2304577 RepID=UPI001379553C|nr:hypothetical protein [Pseudoflavonifractor sp. 524-17]NCE64075.1 hypothetical protein [Pseudoflavonifractor sp. 524-17]